MCYDDPELFCAAFQVLVERVVKEINNPTKLKRAKYDQEANKLIMYKVWNTLRAVCTDQELVKRYLPQIDQFLLPTLGYLETEQNMGYEDDIVGILESTVRISGNLSQNLSNVILLFPTIAKKFNHRVTLLSECYNTLMRRVPAVFDTATVLDNMLTIAANAAKINHDPANLDTSISESVADLFKVEGILMFIMIIENLKEKLSEGHWRGIFDTVIEQLSDMSKNKRYYNSRLLGVFMAALYYKPVITIVYMVSTNTMEKIVELAIKNSAFFYTDVDRKLLILGLISLFSAKVDQMQFDKLAFQCMECVLHLLQIQRVAPNLKAQHYNKAELRTKEENEDISQYEEAIERIQKMADGQQHYQDPEEYGSDEEFGSESDSDDYEDAFKQVYASQKRRAKETVKNLVLQVSSVDEFQTFQDAIRKYKVVHGLILASIWRETLQGHAE